MVISDWLGRLGGKGVGRENQNMAHDMDTKSQFIELRARGWSFGRISKSLGVSKQTLIAWGKEYRLTISNLRSAELDALQRKYLNSVEGRLKLFGQALKNVEKELKNRDLSDVPTRELFEMFLRLIKESKAEQVDTVFKEEVDLDLSFGALDKITNSWEV
jgi:hypothetical protein